MNPSDGYREAFYEIADALGVVPDGVSSPQEVFKSVMLPRIGTALRLHSAELAEAVRNIPIPKRGFHEGWRDEEIWEWALREAAKLIEAPDGQA